jgi:DNA repair exonuclease SbcCD nuclease subunit
MKSFSFVHAADLHLDSPFSGLRSVDEQLAGLLKDATFRAFDNVVELALERKVDFLLVAGDVYDVSERSLRAQLKFADGLKKLAKEGIRSLVCHGNHDPLDGWSASLDWPEEVHIFGPTLESVPVLLGGEEEVLVHGISYPHSQVEDTFGRDFQRQGPQPFQIGLIHCSVGSDPAHETYAPRSLEELVAAHLDYWALGHVHRHQVLMDGHPFITYPGTIQGRHIRETGPRGCLVVHVGTAGEVAAVFEPVDVVRWVRCEVQIEHLETEGDLVEKLEQVIEEIRGDTGGRPAIARITLTGRGPLHSSLRRPQIEQDLTERLREAGFGGTPVVWLERLQDESKSGIDLERRREAADFLGEVLRLIEDRRRQPEELHQIVSELYQSRRARRFLEVPTREEFLDILNQVENLCINELVVEEVE